MTRREFKLSIRSGIRSAHRLLTHEVLRQSGVIALAQLVVILLGFANTALLARLLDPQQLGAYQYLLTWVAVAAVCGLPGMGMPLLKSTLKNYDRFYWLAIRRSMVTAGTSALLVGIFGAFFYWRSAEWRSIGLVLLLVAASIPIAGLENYESVLIGKQDFKTSRLIQIFSSAIILIATALAAWIFSNTEYVFAAYLVSRSIVTAAAFLVVRRRLEACLADPVLDAELLSQGWRQTVLSAFILLASKLDRIVLGTLNPVLLAQYHIGTIIPVSIKNNAKLILGILGSRWGRLDARGNSEALRRYGKILIFVGIATFSVMALALPVLIPFFFGETYRTAVWIGIVFSLSLVPAYWNHMRGLEDQIQLDGKFTQVAQVVRYVAQSISVIFLVKIGTFWIALAPAIADFTFMAMFLFHSRMHSKAA